MRAVANAQQAAFPEVLHYSILTGTRWYTPTMQSKAATVQQYLEELPPDRRAAIAAVRAVILENLDADYVEGMSYGMIGYGVPHSFYPPGYHCDPKQPLPFAALASQKNYMSIYLCSVYGAGNEEDWFRKAWTISGKKLDMGKSCIRFKTLADLPLDVIGEAIRRVPAKKYIEHYEQVRATMSQGANRKAARKSKAATKKTQRRVVRKK